MAQIKCQRAEMKLQLVGHADDAKSRRVDAERGRAPPALRPLSVFWLWQWRDSFIESLHFAHAVSTVCCLPFLGQLARARRISISVWLLFCAFAYAINLARAATAKGSEAK